MLAGPVTLCRYVLNCVMCGQIGGCVNVLVSGDVTATETDAVACRETGSRLVSRHDLIVKYWCIVHACLNLDGLSTGSAVYYQCYQKIRTKSDPCPPP